MKQVNTQEWISKQLKVAIKAARKAGIDVEEDEFVTATALPDGMIAILGAENKEDGRVMKIQIGPGVVLPPANVELNFFAHGEGSDDETD